MGVELLFLHQCFTSVDERVRARIRRRRGASMNALRVFVLSFLLVPFRFVSFRFVSYRSSRLCWTLLHKSRNPLTHALGHEGILILFIAVWITAIERVHRSIIGVRDGERIVTFLPASARARVMDAVRVDPLRPAFRRTRRWARRRGAFGARVQRRRLLFIREKHVCDG